MRRLLLGLLLVGAACSTGPTAPPINGTDVACIEGVCLVYPIGWDVEQGDAYIAFTHAEAPGQANATIAPVNMQAIVENAGGSWPAQTEDTVRAFWQLLEDADVADLDRLERLTGGAFRSEGSYEDGIIWHLLVPRTGIQAVAVEVRAPNASWETHADVFFSNVEVFE